MTGKVLLPTGGDLGNVVGCYQSCAWALGSALGDHFQEQLSPKFGERWFKQLKEQRRNTKNPGTRENLFDLSYALSEVLEFSNSPLRDALPRDSRFYKQLEKMRRERNDWIHCEMEPNLANLKKSISRMRDVAAELELQVSVELVAAIQRIDELSGGLWHAPSPQPAASALKELVGLALDNPPHGCNSELKDMQAEAARDVVEALRPKGVSRFWTLPLPTRRLKLLPRSLDVRDPQTGASCLSELGDEPRRKVKNWLRLLPDGGDIYLDESGAVIGSVRGVMRIIGYSGELPELPEGAMQGFLIDDLYVWNEGKICVPGMNQSASGVSIVAPNRFKELADCVLKVTDCGDIGFASVATGEWTRIGVLKKGDGV